MTQPKHLGRKTIYESPWINLHLDQVQLPSGKIIEEYHTVEYLKEGVAVIATNPKGEILMIEAWRYRDIKPSWEVPAGFIEFGEKPLEAGVREVLEETGYKVEDPQYIFTYQPSKGIVVEVAHVVFGQVKDMNQGEFDTDEVKSTHWMSKKEVKEMIKKNEISDGYSLIPLLMYLNQ